MDVGGIATSLLRSDGRDGAVTVMVEKSVGVTEQKQEEVRYEIICEKNKINAEQQQEPGQERALVTIYMCIIRARHLYCDVVLVVTIVDRRGVYEERRHSG